MSVIEAAGRGGAISLLLLLAVLLFRDERNVSAARYIALLAIATAAGLVIFAPSLSADRALWLLPLRIAGFGNAAAFWIMASALFDDGFRLSWRHVAAWLGLVALGFWAVYSEGSYRFLPLNVFSLVCAGLALWQALAERDGDLVETRRKLRLFFVVSVGLFLAGVVVSVILLQGGQGYPVFEYVDAYGALALTFLFATLLLSPIRDALFMRSPLASVAKHAASSDDPREPELLALLLREMTAKRAYRNEALSIGVLAAKLGLPEYRLRRLINQRLGYRNFNAFLNSYRLEEAMAALADVTQAEVPILTIALDAGFQSIGPFNRAFKTVAGMTPSEFRREKLGRPS